MSDESTERALLQAEERVRHRVDASGTRWVKVYIGGGAHLRNWLAQTKELAGEENVETERIDGSGLACFEQDGEELYRVWVREGAMGGQGAMGEEDGLV